MIIDTIIATTMAKNHNLFVGIKMECYDPRQFLKLYGKVRPLASFACYQASYFIHKEISYSV